MQRGRRLVFTDTLEHRPRHPPWVTGQVDMPAPPPNQPRPRRVWNLGELGKSPAPPWEVAPGVPTPGIYSRPCGHPAITSTSEPDRASGRHHCKGARQAGPGLPVGKDVWRLWTLSSTHVNMATDRRQLLMTCCACRCRQLLTLLTTVGPVREVEVEGVPVRPGLPC